MSNSKKNFCKSLLQDYIVCQTNNDKKSAKRNFDRENILLIYNESTTKNWDFNDGLLHAIGLQSLLSYMKLYL